MLTWSKHFIFKPALLVTCQVFSYILPTGWNDTCPRFFPLPPDTYFSFLFLSLCFENKLSLPPSALRIKAAAKGYSLQICQVSEEQRSNRDCFPSSNAATQPAPGISQPTQIPRSPLAPLERQLQSVFHCFKERESGIPPSCT